MPLPIILAALAAGGANFADDRRIERKEARRLDRDAGAAFRAAGFELPGANLGSRGEREVGPSADLTGQQALLDSERIQQDLNPRSGVDSGKLGGIHDLLTSQDPAMRTRGFAALQAQTPAARTAAEFAFEKEMVAMDQAEVDLASSRFDLEVARDNRQLNRAIKIQDYQTGAENLRAAALGTPLDLNKPVPLANNPYTGTPTMAWLPGTKEFANQQAAVDATSAITEDVNKMYELTDLAGSEIWNDEIVGKMRTLHSSLIPRMSQFFGSGTPQEAEMRLYEKMLPNPNSWTSQMGGLIGNKDRWLSAINGLEMMMSRKLKQQASINPYLKVDTDLYNPAIVSPAQAAFIDANLPDPGVYIRGR